MYDVLKSTVARLMELDIPVLVGGLAFYGALSVFPSIALALLLYGLVVSHLDVLEFAAAIQNLLPEPAQRILLEEFELLSDWAAHHLSSGIIVTVALIAWSAMSGWKALISAVRVVAGENKPLTIVGYQFQSLMLSFAFIGAIVSGIVLFLILFRILDGSAVELSSRAGQPEDATLRSEIFVWTVASTGICLALYTIYRVSISPANASSRDCALGAIGATAVWLVAISLFDLYAERVS